MTINAYRPTSTQIEDEPLITCAQCKRHAPVSECNTAQGCGDELFCAQCQQDMTPSYGEDQEFDAPGWHDEAYSNEGEYGTRGYSEACGIWD